MKSAEASLYEPHVTSAGLWSRHCVPSGMRHEEHLVYSVHSFAFTISYYPATANSKET